MGAGTYPTVLALWDNVDVADTFMEAVLLATRVTPPCETDRVNNDEQKESKP
jgi:hypothetical protein